MKRYLLGVFAIAFAVIAFAFTSAEKDMVQCQDVEYVWFKVKTQYACTSFGSVTPTSTDLDFYPISSADPIADITALGFVGKESQILSLNRFPGCVTLSNYVCAVAYVKDPNNFVPDATNQFWKPIPGLVPVCAICRPTAP